MPTKGNRRKLNLHLGLRAPGLGFLIFKADALARQCAQGIAQSWRFAAGAARVSVGVSPVLAHEAGALQLALQEFGKAWPVGPRLGRDPKGGSPGKREAKEEVRLPLDFVAETDFMK